MLEDESFGFVVPFADFFEESFSQMRDELQGKLHPLLGNGYEGMGFINNDTSWTLSIDGPSADKIRVLVTPILAKYEFMRGIECTLKYTSPGASRAVKFAFGS